MEKEQQHGHGQSTDGQIDVKAPPPRNMVGEGATDQGAEHGGDAVSGTVEADHLRAHFGLSDEADDCEGARANACTAEARDGAADDQRRRARGDGADQAAHLEDADGHDEPYLQVEVFEQFPPRRLEPAEGHEVRRAVPRHVVEAVELVGDFGDRGSKNGL